MRLTFVIGLLLASMHSAGASSSDAQSVDLQVQLRAQRLAYTLVPSDFDGRWWEQISADEKLGFLTGLNDCVSFDRKPWKAFDGTDDEKIKKIDGYFTPPYKRGQSSKTPVLAAVDSMSYLAPERLSATEIEESRANGEYWKQNSDELTRLGLLEGYFSCSVQGSQARKWSKPIVYYLKKLDVMYNVENRDDLLKSEYDGTVASALDKLRDPP